MTNINPLTNFLKDEAITHFFPEKYHQYLQVMTYQKGQLICSQGDTLEHIAYLLSGRAKVIRHSANGKEHILETIEQPTIIGDIELLTQRPAVSSVIALTECVLVQLPLCHQTALLADPLFLYHIGREIAHKCYQQNISSAANITYSVKERLATHILKHAQEDHYHLELSLLADAFGTSYRHLSRVIKQMVDEGLLSKTSSKTYTITDRQKLQHLAIQE